MRQESGRLFELAAPAESLPEAIAEHGRVLFSARS
jgi:hypothetical protein